MPYSALFLAASLVLAPSLPGQAPILSGQAAAPGQTGSAQKPQPKKEKKVWTNDDLEELRGKGRVSVVGQVFALPAAESTTEGEKPAAGGPEKAGVPAEPYVREKDPEWYRERLAPLRAELERIDSEIRRLREFRTSGRASQGGLVLGQGNIPLNPENQIEQLQRRRRDVQRQIDAIEDQARQNGIPPGSIR